jgi:hypothetical protein
MRKKLIILASAVALMTPGPALAYGEAVNGFKALDHCISESNPGFLNMFRLNIWIRCGWF